MRYERTIGSTGWRRYGSRERQLMGHTGQIPRSMHRDQMGLIRVGSPAGLRGDFDINASLIW